MLGNRRQSLTSASYPATDFNLTLIYRLSRSGIVSKFLQFTCFYLLSVSFQYTGTLQSLMAYCMYTQISCVVRTVHTVQIIEEEPAGGDLKVHIRMCILCPAQMRIYTHMEAKKGDINSSFYCKATSSQNVNASVNNISISHI